MKKILLLLCFISLIPSGKAQVDTALATQLQNLISTRVSPNSNRGVASYVIMPNGQTWSGRAGVNAQNVPITDSTLFYGASTTKLNIAILMLLLAEDSLIRLDDSWHKYLPSLNVPFDTSITIRQLLNHTSGIADYLETPATLTNVTTNFSYSYTPHYILQSVVSPTPYFPAATNFTYSTSNYVLAALIAETVTGHPVQQELRTRVWNPVGMRHTYFGATETYTESTAGVWFDFGNGLTNYSNQPQTSILSYGYGGANIVSCPRDLALLLDALFHNRLVSAASLHEMLTFVPASYSSWTKGYGLGIHHSAQAYDTVLGHDGDYANLTDMFYSKKYGFTLVTMTNTETTWFGLFNPMYALLVKYFKTVGIVEYEDKAYLNIYPNPSNGQVMIQSSKEIDAITIRNVLGQLLYESGTSGKEIRQSFDKEGVYFVSLRSGSQVITSKVVVQH